MNNLNLTMSFANSAEYVTNTDSFAVYTMVARMLAAEDIIVRWNVRGMGCPASMNYATRVLDVAPIRKDREHMIPGLVLHEIGHFLFSENAAVEGTSGHSIDTDKTRALRAAIKNEDIWNIIEDGYVERRVVAKWPGALKHLRVLYDFQLEMHAKEGPTPDKFCATTVINLLLMNVIGAKWGDRFSYPKFVAPKLLGLLEQARTCFGTPMDRAVLSTKIANEMAKALRPRKAKVVQANVTNGAQPSVESLIEMFEELAATAVEAKRELPPPTVEDVKAIERFNTRQEEAKAQDAVDESLNADSIIAQRAEQPEPTPLPEASEPEAPAPELTAEPEDNAPKTPTTAKSGAGKPSKQAQKDQSPKDDDKEVAPEQPLDGVVEGLEADDEDYAFLEQHISDSKARIIGENRTYLENVMAVEDATPANGADSVRHIPSPAQVLATSETLDILDEKTWAAVNKVSFRQFQAALLKSSSPEAKRMPAIFNKKMITARSAAQLMFQRFTTKANSINIALTKQRPTGVLDPTRAALYKIYDDVFQKRQQAPRQINHAYVVMVDWSSSMDKSSMELFHRIIELVFFAQLANVEIDIWLYTTSGDHLTNVIKEKKPLLQENVMLLGSTFTHVVNTKRHTGDVLNYRLFAMLINAAAERNNHLWRTLMVRGTEHLLGDLNFADGCTHRQRGTNIFEALSFGISQAEKLTAQRKAVLLLTDGEDNGFGSVVGEEGERKMARIPHDLTYDSTGQITRVMYNGANLIDIARAAKAADEIRGRNETRSHKATPLVQVRTLASLLLADEARKQGISIIGVTWGSFISSHMNAWARGNVVRISVPFKDLHSKSLTVYSPVENTFITQITEALLSNIKT